MSASAEGNASAICSLCDPYDAGGSKVTSAAAARRPEVLITERLTWQEYQACNVIPKVWHYLTPHEITMQASFLFPLKEKHRSV
jgi:hypothetical protein